MYKVSIYKSALEKIMNEINKSISAEKVEVGRKVDEYTAINYIVNMSENIKNMRLALMTNPYQYPVISGDIRGGVELYLGEIFLYKVIGQEVTIIDIINRLDILHMPIGQP